MEGSGACVYLLFKMVQRQLDDCVQRLVGLRPISEAAHQLLHVCGAVLGMHCIAVLLCLQQNSLHRDPLVRSMKAMTTRIS